MWSVCAEAPAGRGGTPPGCLFRPREPCQIPLHLRGCKQKLRQFSCRSNIKPASLSHSVLVRRTIRSQLFNPGFREHTTVSTPRLNPVTRRISQFSGKSWSRLNLPTAMLIQRLHNYRKIMPPLCFFFVSSSSSCSCLGVGGVGRRYYASAWLQVPLLVPPRVGVIELSA